MNKLTLQLNDAQSGHQAMAFAWGKIKPLLLAGHKLQLEVRPRTRSLEQNARLHAMLQDVAEQVQWAGQRLSVDQWKRLMTSAWLRARGEQVQVLPALDGNGVDVIYEKTSRMTVRQVSELCDYVEAWGSEHGVVFSGPGEWAGGETGEIAC